MLQWLPHRKLMAALTTTHRSGGMRAWARRKSITCRRASEAAAAVVAESHAEEDTVGKRHVERVRSVRIDDELQVRRGLRLSLLHLLAETSRRHRVGAADEHQQRRVEHAADIALTTRIKRDTRDKWARMFQRDAQSRQYRPAAIRHAHHGDARGVDVRLLRHT